MTVADALKGISRLGLDSAPIIYFVEKHPVFYPLCLPFFTAMGTGSVEAVTSALTFTETLTVPLRNNNVPLINLFRNLLSASRELTTYPVSLALAEQAADLRARYNLRTPDAVQVATALEAGCDAFLTNDRGLHRVTEINVLVLESLTV